ncbi:hypothetical protein M2459_001339 [Parabacteroides sp. PF5-5]|uniref:KilA-N domain-containing protein n=1 Tax=unclassified Parabacteroides TaxID=2649774 RepID=UPI002475BC23|nr:MULTISPECIES: KilA-N domain-containing protein [unclassified Parabacteroides]MDH6304604.1 hypothetical protein [Parabacteroides sp. PH5-39]MDH6315783.1 hypothetical protein [Parabacteroides sp. PF5-13]MDH6319442.1 hypothetical protein [Parabacteroides sp. PH5-13]MDH6323173.1 hypothetical protein [Parabacteroides sp. PH5-8]MDH6326975.1 hypothetical protein [Parabacteroides sp. PH5-41]
MAKKNEIRKYDANILSNIGKEGEMLSLTDLWKAAGSVESKAPKHWLGNEQTKGFIHALSKFLKVTDSYLIKIKRGKSGGSYGHKQIALEYAQYLDQDLGVLVNEVFFQRIEEENNPDLAIDRGIRGYKRQGRTDKWIAKRLEGKGIRNTFTSILAAHGCGKEGYRNCTNAIYQPLFGGTSNVVRQKYGIEKSKSIRDNLPMLELQAISFSEALASDDIEKNDRHGDAQCEVSARNAANVVKDALMKYKRISI